MGPVTGCVHYTPLLLLSTVSPPGGRGQTMAISLRRRALFSVACVSLRSLATGETPETPGDATSAPLRPRPGLRQSERSTGARALYEAHAAKSSNNTRISRRWSGGLSWRYPGGMPLCPVSFPSPSLSAPGAPRPLPGCIGMGRLPLTPGCTARCRLWGGTGGQRGWRGWPVRDGRGCAGSAQGHSVFAGGVDKMHPWGDKAF